MAVPAAPAAADADFPIPESVDDVRGLTPEEMVRLVDVVDVKIRSLHQTDQGEIRDLDATEQAAMNHLLAVRAKAKEKIEWHNQISGILRDKPKSVLHTFSRQDVMQTRDLRSMTPSEVRDHALRVLDSREVGVRLDAPSKDQVERSIRRDRNVSRLVVLTENDAYRSGYMKVMTGMNPAFLLEEERDAIGQYLEFRAGPMAENVTTQGGYAVPVTIDPTILLTAQGSGNPFLELARTIPVTTNSYKGVSSAGVSWSFDTESAEVSDDSPAVDQPSVLVHMARGFIKWTIEIGDDWQTFAEQMGELLSSGYDELLLQKFSVGSGTGEPMGIVTKLDATAGSEVLLTTAGAFGAVDVYKTWKGLPQRFRRNAAWMMSVGVNNDIRQFGTAAGIANQTVNLLAEAADVLMRKQVYESPYFPDSLSTTGHANLLVVGDFKQYWIARRSGMETELVQHIIGTTNHRPTGERGWFAHARIGGDVGTTAAFRILNQT